MSATPNDAATDVASASDATNDSSQKVRTTAATKAPNPARPSKFAGLNLRQRSSEQPAIESAELTPAPKTSPEEHDHAAHHEAAVSSDAHPVRGPGARAAGAADLGGRGDAVPAEGQASAAASPKPSAGSTASGPTSEAIESSPAAKASSSQREEPAKLTEQRQQNAISTPLTGEQRNQRSHTEPAAMEQAPARRRGKRTDPEYVQVTAYVRQETYRRARIKLLESTKPQEFSEVVEELLTRWLRSSY